MSLESDTAEATATPRLREIDELPAPPGLPFVGNLLQVDRARIHQQVERWSRDYGPYFGLRLGTRPIFVVSDHAAIDPIFRDRPDRFRRTPRFRQIAQEIGLPAASSPPKACRRGASARRSWPGSTRATCAPISRRW